jgi:hypothetical protein
MSAKSLFALVLQSVHLVELFTCADNECLWIRRWMASLHHILSATITALRITRMDVDCFLPAMESVERV